MKAPPTLPRAAGPRGDRPGRWPGPVSGNVGDGGWGKREGPWKLMGRICLLAGRNGSPRS